MSWMPTSNQSRVVIEAVVPSSPGEGLYVKRVVGEPVGVKAAIYADGHQEISADLLWRKKGEKNWNRIPMKATGNDTWTATFPTTDVGFYAFTICAWIDEYKTWQHDFQKRKKSGHPLAVDYKIGQKIIHETLERIDNPRDRRLLEPFLKRIEQENEPDFLFLDSTLSLIMRRYPKQQNLTLLDRITPIRCQRKKALFSTWYELFPRSFGGFKGVIKELPYLSEMGFDVLYFPPIHPIGHTNRKGKNNHPSQDKTDPGSPWAIGSELGGHDAIHPELGTFDDFRCLVREAKKFNIEIALDFALQCSPDHPYIKSHPQWFLWRPDGTIQYAENPPKKYEDIVPLNFDTQDWQSLWNELLRVLLVWVQEGTRIFRVDNPHTKPFAFWRWLIGQIHEQFPDVIFLSEAFTRPFVMQQLAKVGFDQSYTYFTWRNTKWELTQYLNELTTSPMRDFFRPNFWPNTPDILPEYLQHGGSPAFIIRFILAATLSSNYGIYGPVFELCQNEALEGKEEYLNSEKYEVRKWNRPKENSFRELITIVNQLRKDHAALQDTWNLRFCPIESDYLIAYLKSNMFLIVVNLDPYATHYGMVHLPLDFLGVANGQPFLVHDILSNRRYLWNGQTQYIELNPQQMPAHIFRIYSTMRKEQNFDYFM